MARLWGSRWVNCNKNDINDPDVRCRLVAQEVNIHADDSFYAATPPLEAKRLLFSEWASERTRGGERLQLSFVDVKKAYFYGIPERTIYVRLPYELGMSGKMVGKLVRCMYGTRDAGAIWEGCYTDCLVNMGFTQGAASPCCFTHHAWGVSVVVHGDDFTALGTPTGLNLYEAGMQKVFECKLKGRLGEDASDLKEMRVLNRIVRINKEGLLYEADPRHAELLIKSFNLEACKSVVTPGVKTYAEDEGQPGDDASVPMSLDELIKLVKAQRKPLGRTRFDTNHEVHDVVAHSEVYGQHPKTFNFDRWGEKVPVHEEPTYGNGDDAFIDAMSPNARRVILERTLRNGAAWEVPTTELIAKINKSSKSKFQKARVGSKAAKHAERMEAGGEQLDEESATMYRALSARFLYLSLDRPECAFADKTFCRNCSHPTSQMVRP